MGYFPLYRDSGDEIVWLPTDPPPATVERLAVMQTGEEMREALLLDILGEIRQMYPHHHLDVKLTPMDLLGEPISRVSILPLRQATVQIVERP
jgi:hypothetical protein